MTSASVEEVKARLSAYVDRAQAEGPVTITRNGKPVAVIIAPANLEDLESLLLARSPKFVAMIESSRRSVRDGQAIASPDFWNQVEQRTKASKKTASKRRRTRP
jgi:prevent-host-death family protein